LLDSTLREPYGLRSAYSNSPYLSLFIKNVYGFNLELGSRYTMHGTYGNNFTYSINPSYLIKERFKLFFNLASGFKAPSLNSLYSPFYGNDQLGPERGTTYEFGFQTDLLREIIELRAVGFKRDMKDVIAFINNRYMNFNLQNDKGVEIELAIRPIKALDIKVNYAYVDGLVTTTDPNTQKDSSYNNLFRRPNHTGSLQIGYQVCKPWQIRAQLSHTGNRNDLYYAPGSWTGENVVLKAYTLLDFYTEYKFGSHARVFLNLNNITNNRKFEEIKGYAVRGFNIQTGIAFNL
jgi:vitamin B12 transporter